MVVKWPSLGRHQVLPVNAKNFEVVMVNDIRKYFRLSGTSNEDQIQEKLYKKKMLG